MGVDYSFFMGQGMAKKYEDFPKDFDQWEAIEELDDYYASHPDHLTNYDLVGDHMSGENLAVIIFLPEYSFAGNFYEMSQFGILNLSTEKVELTDDVREELEDIAKILKIEEVKVEFLIATAVS